MQHLVHLLIAFSTTVLGDTCWRSTNCTGPTEAAFSGPWDSNNFAPSSRIIHPKNTFNLNDVQAVVAYDSESSIRLDNNTSAVVFDFGLEVGGIATVEYNLTGSSATLGLAFTEARDFIGRQSDSSRGGDDAVDGAIYHQLDDAGEGRFTMPGPKLRGGFRYLTVFVEAGNNDTGLRITDVSVELSFQPTWSNLRAYQGYFHSEDELLNKVWYSGAWTLQSNSIPGDRGMRTPDGDGWDNVEIISDSDTVLVDGAKRDRLIWNGDMGTAVPSAFVSTGDLESTRSALDVIYQNQNDDGQFPKAGPPNAMFTSDTYHLWHLIGTYNYLLYSGDTDFITSIWPKYITGLNRSLSLLTSAGIMNVTGEDDWGRFTYSNERASASILLYYALQTGSTMASWIPNLATRETNYTDQYKKKAEVLHKAIMKELWDNEVGAFRDSPSSNLYPQDANSMGIAFGVVTGKNSERVSSYLHSNWTPIGPACPELPENVSPFITSIELRGHAEAGRPDRTVELIHSLWAWYINHENSTQSTTPEGFHVDGSWNYRKQRGYTKGGPLLDSGYTGWASHVRTLSGFT